jgi:hypothetical protein
MAVFERRISIATEGETTMTYVDPTEFEWQAVKDKDGARIEVRCPLCGAILFEALTNLQDAESPADIIGDILQGHWFRLIERCYWRGDLC